MSFIGNFAAAQSARAIGKYNEGVYKQRADLQRARTAQNKAIYDKLDRPRLVKKQDSEYDFLFVRALKTGAEVREGTSPYLALLETRYNQATDLQIADFRSNQANFDGLNESLLLESKAAGARFKGDLTARTETIKGVGSLLSTGYELS
tara:strand:+ start:585 stop:1031 length:447 start_codon:yes stop_codon:yes gene_type:complete